MYLDCPTAVCSHKLLHVRSSSLELPGWVTPASGRSAVIECLQEFDLELELLPKYIAYRHRYRSIVSYG